MFFIFNSFFFIDLDYNYKFNLYVNVNFCMFIIIYDDCIFVEFLFRFDV